MISSDGEAAAAEHRSGFLKQVKDSAEQLGGFRSEAVLVTKGVDLEAPGILLIPELGTPAFQFDGDTLRPIVAEINMLLGAQEDPHGVADWWLLSNAHLADDSPAKRLISGESRPTTSLALTFSVNISKAY